MRSLPLPLPLPLLLPLLAAPVAAQNLLALTADNRLVPLRATTPLSAGPATQITGLQSGESIVGIDFRPLNGRLYGLGDQHRLYTIDPVTGVATAVGGPFITPMMGNEFGFDFNPTVDRIRVVSDTGHNVRLNPDTGAVAATDAPLAFAPNDPNAGATPMVAASGYTNSVAGATSTLLFGIDAGRDVLVTQNPPNNGTLNTVGSLGRDVTAVLGFDISPGGTAYAALNTAGATNGTTQLFTVDLMTGSTSWIGTIGNGNPNARLRGLAVVPPRPDVEIVALTDDGRLARFDATTPWAAPAVATLSGMLPGEQLTGIDFRPATGQLYGLGSHSRVYVVDPTSGVAAVVGSGFAPLLNGTAFGFDFNPTVDRIRVVSNTGQNLRLNPETGGVAATDGPLAYATTDPNAAQSPGVTASAYTNDLAGATSTLLYGIDTSLDVLVTQNPPNNGTLNTVGPLGRDVTGVSGFDIGSDGRAYAVLTDATGSRLYRVNLANGGLTALGDLGLATGASIRGLAVRTVNGLSAFGTSTPGCAGVVWLGAAGTPYAGSPLFTVVAHRGPPNAIGFFVLTAARLATPMDFGGLLAWVDPMTTVAMPMRMNDAFGTGELVMPLTGAWFGLEIYSQWVGLDSCGPMHLSASAGLKIVVQ